MSRYMIICRLRWPAVLLLTGVIALLDQADILSWGRAWPLYLILFGVLALAERATLASEAPPPPGYPYAPGYQAAGYAPQPGPYPGTSPAPGPQPPSPQAPASTGIVPAHTDLDIRNSESDREPRKSWEEEGR
jgi:hypothetical protein